LILAYSSSWSNRALKSVYGGWYLVSPTAVVAASPRKTSEKDRVVSTERVILGRVVTAGSRFLRPFPPWCGSRRLAQQERCSILPSTLRQETLAFFAVYLAVYLTYRQ
ncbi:unnamed protein product, partial [Ectocarpus sp. 4 AP-2014]